MKISELSAATDVPVGTIKYYLREGLVRPGERTSRTTARYDHSHVERIRLVRALTDAGGLGIAQIKRVIDVIDADAPPRLDVLATAQDALVDGDVPAGRVGPADGPPSVRAAPDGGAPEGGASGRAASDGETSAWPTSDCPASTRLTSDRPASTRPASTPPSADQARDWAERRGWFSYDGDRVIGRFER